MENLPKKKLFDLVREAIYRKNYSKRTEEALHPMIKRYIFFTTNVINKRWGVLKLRLF